TIYRERCADCHGRNGEGKPYVYPPLAGNRLVTAPEPTNLIRNVMLGGFPPSTHGNPRPYGMPPFAHQLGAADAAAVLTYIRTSWGNDAPPVTADDVERRGYAFYERRTADRVGYNPGARKSDRKENACRRPRSSR